ncbi:oxygenase MpaB family protein [Actinocorallia sp. A-T 12471]|uniref:oxygenase MpaB family protein n=1 Tax=Actinocorallia sp. A-T 12471 TaxID=3089813 RepID=UPI0029D14476|nr:oxygenase MpaB family protein [Actinocorallia sp. A-T 12471]MDX6743556.1 oxygenase MpaB family protein [Actinocorallia sp. A-T 12471]
MQPLGPTSLTWRFFGDNRALLVGPRAGVLQLMLPELGQGVLDHSVFFSDTLGRLKRSAGPILNTVYGGQDAAATGATVRDYHRDIKGVMPDGDRYHALDPEIYFWAHATFVDHLFYATETFMRPLTEAERRVMYEESKTWYAMYGVSDRAVPEDWEAFQEYWHKMLTEKVAAHKSAKYSVGYAEKGLPRPKEVPAVVWKVISRPVNAVARFLTVGGLPPETRKILGLPWSAADERRYRTFARTVRRADGLWNVLPRAVRYAPPARAAFARYGSPR